GVVVTFMSILELVKEGIIDLVQTESFGPIHVKARAQRAEGEGYDLGDDMTDDAVEDAFEATAPVLEDDAVQTDFIDDDFDEGAGESDFARDGE
ncbi:MAG: hypothetical protein Q8J78_14685, partial [Moraxellaceae bacterium]|nr:hypothetical protein [Moraxellaceae bacterium]